MKVELEEEKWEEGMVALGLGDRRGRWRSRGSVTGGRGAGKDGRMRER